MDYCSPNVDGDSPLHMAVRQSNLEDIRKILENQDVDVNTVNCKQETPLSIACILRNNDVIELLVAFGANLFLKDLDTYGKSNFDIQDLLNKLLFKHDFWIKGPTLTSGDTPLHTAVRVGRLGDIQEKILDQEHEINQVNSSHETPLHLACALGHKHIIHFLLSKGADMYIRDCYNNAPIHRAASQGHVDVVELLIRDFLCNPMIKGYQGKILLHFACSVGNAELVSTLIEKYGINPHTTDAVNQTPLHIAASNGQEEILCLLINRYNCPVDCKSNFKSSPLHLASYCGHVSVVKTLVLKFKADVNLRNIAGSTPFLKAVMGGNLEVVEMMITDFDIDPLSAINDSGDTPLHMASMCGHEELARLLITKYNCPVDIKNKNKETPLHKACLSGRHSVVGVFVSEFKADTSACDHIRNAPLNKAALGGHTDIIQILINEYGCSSKIKGQGGRSLLHQACDQGYDKLAKILIADFGLDPLSVDNCGNTPLHMACGCGHQELARLFITKYKCPVDVKNKNKETPLHKACSSGHLNVVRVLVSEFKSDTSLRNDKNDTAISKAAEGGHMEIVQALITELGCSPKVTGYDSRSLLHEACYSGSIKLTEMLITDFSLDISSVDNSGNTPLHMACSCGHEELARLLITKYNCPVDIINKKKETPLHFACLLGHSTLIRMLISDFKGNPQIRDHYNDTPINNSALGGHVDAVQMLITDFKCSPQVKGFEGRSLLHQACDKGHTKLALVLITDFNLDPLSVDKRGDSPLHMACLGGHEELARQLITKYNCPINNNETVLYYACIGGSVKLVDFLICSIKFNPFCVNSDGNTPLHIAATFNCGEIVRLLIAKYRCPINCTNKFGQTPLHLAINKGHINLCTALISEFAADANTLDKKHDTPLNVAIKRGNAEDVHILAMEFGCKPYVKGAESKPLLHQLAAGGFTVMLHELIFNFNHDPASVDEDGNTLLHIAALYGQYEVIELIITSYGSCCPIDCRNSHGQTPLHCACIGGNEHVAKLLVTNKSMINARDEARDSPLKKAYDFGHTNVLSAILHVVLVSGYDLVNIDSKLLCQACECGSLELVDVLIVDFKLNPYSVVDIYGNTPLHIAAYFGHKAIASLLIKFGCPIDSMNFQGETPLHLICSSGFVDPTDSFKLMNLYISKFKADVTKTDVSGDQPIHKSAQAGYTGIITSLVFDYGCDPHARGSNNTTVLHQALAKGRTSTAKVLIEMFKLSIHSIDNDGNTPLHLSSRFKQEESVKLLLYTYHAPVFIRNKAGETAVDLANDNLKSIFRSYTSSEYRIIQAEYRKLWTLSSRKYSGQHSITRVFVLGYPGSGKSTLVESLKRKGTIASRRLVSEADVPAHTAGIVPSTHQSKEAGQFLYFDFAGDIEYYSSHSAILETVSHSSIGDSVYVIVATMTNDNGALCNELGYWLSFISYHAKIFDSQNKLKVIIVLSHPDLLTSFESANKLDAMKYYLKNCSDQLNQRNLNIIDTISANCRRPRSSKAVVDSICQASKGISPYNLSTEVGLLYGALEKDFGNVIACKFLTLLKHIKATGICLPTEARALYPIVKELHDIGLLMVIGRSEDQIENHLIITNISSLTNEVHKMLFSKTAKQKFSSTVSSQYAKMGIFPESFISNILPHHITKECLVQLQYCQEFSHADVGLDYSVTQNTESNDLLLYFPALCQLESEHTNWPNDPDLNFSIGWFAKCIGKLDYFPPRYLHVLLLRLTFMFALPASTTPTFDLDLSICLGDQNCRCTMWKNGIHWLMREGVECIVEVVNENKGVVVVVKSREQHTYQCIHMLTQITNVITEAKTEFCNSVLLRHYVLNSDDLASYKNEDKLYDLNMIKAAMENKDEIVVSASGRQTVTVEALKHLKCHTCWGFYFSIKASVVLQYIEEIVEKWEALGLALQLPYHIIRGINMDQPDIESKRKELIRRWMNSPELCGPACWWLLIKALEDNTVKLEPLSARIRAELGEIIALQEKLLEPQYLNQKPDGDFLQSFAKVVDNRWSSLASLLSLSLSDIEEIKREKERVSQAKQALHMLRKWNSRENATYGQLLESLKTVPLFRC